MYTVIAAGAGNVLSAFAIGHVCNWKFVEGTVVRELDIHQPLAGIDSSSCSPCSAFNCNGKRKVMGRQMGKLLTSRFVHKWANKGSVSSIHPLSSIGRKGKAPGRLGVKFGLNIQN